MPEVRATVRLQFNCDFTFEDAIPLVPYFNELGISHIYTSPILKARAGSKHGYDVVDPTQVNPELGGEAALERLVAELRQYHMGLIVDIVSNHMAVGRDDNPWWLDVLKWGAKSRYGQFFDIQWNSPDPALTGQLLVPFLRSHYGEVLAAGEISIHFNNKTGEFYARYFDHHFPLSPASYCHILHNTQDPILLELTQPFAELESIGDGWQAAEVLHQQLSKIAKQPEQQANIAAALSLYNIAPNDSPTPEATPDNLLRELHADDNLYRLHHLLELQYYRLASWRTAADDINWRRFFDVNELGGLRVERQEVFEAIHAKIFDLVEKGLIDGLRIDHVDGLANPRAYCRKLRRRLDRLAQQRPQGLEQDHLPLYVEKILGDDEELTQNWLVDGTTGYEFMNQVSLLQHDPKGAIQLYDLWSRISGRERTFNDEVKEARRLVLSSSLVGDVEAVTQGLLAIARLDITTRDFTLSALRRALIELVVHFPVYRTYVTVSGRTSADQNEYFNTALTNAKTTLAEADWPLLDYLDRWLGGEALHELPPGATRDLRRKIIARFQQLTSPTAAKAVEDTACYRSAVLLSRNDVGFDPHNFSAPPARFHERNSKRVCSFPRNLLTTATHDHKRGEDTRARIAVISERAVWFAEKVTQWQTMSKPLCEDLEDGIAPSPGDEIILYQTLLGCWPLNLMPDDKQGLEVFLERLLRWQEKALREAKLRTHWNAPNVAYEKACALFLTHLLTEEKTHALRNDIFTAALSIAPAGAINSLSQTLLRMTCPGVPDLYQGTEFWDFSLVDPDNRQAVDFAARIAALTNIGTVMPYELLQQWKDGRVKQWLINRTLTTRKQYAELFAQGNYQPLTIEGERAEHLIAFAREYNGDTMIVIIPRLTNCMLTGCNIPLIPAEAWGNTTVLLPQSISCRIFNDCLGAGVQRIAPDGRLSAKEVLSEFPVYIAVAPLRTQPITSFLKSTLENLMMNTYEQNIREFAYQIWESEGRPIGHDCRHWDMACKLAEGLNNKDADEIGSGHVLSVIAPEEPSSPPTTPNTVPADPISPVETPPHISPTPLPQHIEPTDPVQPGNPAKPIQPYTSKRTSAATKAALDEDGVEPAPKKKPVKPRKTRTSKSKDPLNV